MFSLLGVVCKSFLALLLICQLVVYGWVWQMYLVTSVTTAYIILSNIVKGNEI